MSINGSFKTRRDSIATTAIHRKNGLCVCHGTVCICDGVTVCMCDGMTAGVCVCVMVWQYVCVMV